MYIEITLWGNADKHKIRDFILSVQIKLISQSVLLFQNVQLIYFHNTIVCSKYGSQVNFIQTYYYINQIKSLALLRQVNFPQNNPYLSMRRTASVKYQSGNSLIHQDEKEEMVQEIQGRIEQDVNLESRQKNNNDSNFILTCLKNHFIFYNLSEAELENIKDKMLYAKVKEGTTIYDESIKGSCFFIVEKGRLEIISDQVFKKELKPQDGFGEIALLYNTTRRETVIASTDCTLWVIDRKTFREAVQEVIVKEYTENRKNLEGIRFFVNLTNDQKDIIASALITQKFYKNQTIVQEGDPGSSLYYIKEGTASVFKGNKFLRKLGKGDSFGEQSLYYNTMRQLTVRSDEEVTCLVLGRDTLNRVLGDKVYDVTFKNFIRWAFQKNPIMNKFSREQMDNIIDSMRISSLKINELVFRKGVAGFQKLVVVIEGGLKKLKTGTLVAGKCQCYGEQYLTAENKSKVLDDQIIMQTNGVIAEISDAAFYEAVGNKSYSEIIKNLEYGKQKKFSQYDNMIQKQLQDFDASDLYVEDGLAKGQFGDLYLVKDKRDNQYVAKTLSKQALQEAEVCAFIIDQSKVMNFVSFPFIVRCGKKFQSKHHLVYVTEYVKGQQFYEVLKKLGLLSTDDSRFYTATIIHILEYLENVQVICRDIKPENFLVDHHGYLKLINLSTAKISKADNTNKLARTFTIIGTPHYMAPDIVLGKGYTNLVDLWSLGVCLYEFLCGTLPFGDSSQGAYEIYEEIMQKDLKFPEFIHDKKAKKLIEQLLSHNPDQRHGGSFAALKSHQWFEKFDWDGLLTRNRNVISPPYIPNIGYGKKKSSEHAGKKLSSLLSDLDRNIKIRNFTSSDVDFDWSEFGPKI